MSKGSSNKEEEPKQTGNKDTEENTKDYESLRDLRFSSISIYDKPHFEEDIIITVDDAQKHAAESFVSYKVVTKTTRESFLQHEFHVRRRYQDFLWLSNILIQQYPSNIVPPLPQKKMFNKYDPNFLRLRQLALNKFLCRIAEHPILSASEHFFTFLSAKQVELIEQKKTTTLKKFTIPQLPIANLESPFKSTSEYIEEFGKILSALSTQSSRLDKEQNELENALNALSPSLALWANSEVCEI
jgi:sorting nexin-7/30